MTKAFTLALCGLSLWLIISLKVSEFVQLHGYLSPVSLRLQQLYPNTSCLSNRPKDLGMSFPSVSSLRKNNLDQSAVIHPSTHLVAVILAGSSSVAVRWDSSNILLLSGDVESNPGPRCPDENSIHGIICQNQARHSTRNGSILHRNKLPATMPSSLQCFNSCTDMPRTIWLPQHSVKVSRTRFW